MALQPGIGACIPYACALPLRLRNRTLHPVPLPVLGSTPPRDRGSAWRAARCGPQRRIWELTDPGARVDTVLKRLDSPSIIGNSREADRG